MAKKKPIKKNTKKPASVKANTRPKSVLHSSGGSRLRKLSRRQRRKEAKKVAGFASLPGAWTIFVRSLQHLYRHKKLFLGILLIYGILNLLFVRGLSSNFQIASFRQNLTDTLGDTVSGVSGGIALFGLLLGSSTSTNSEAAGAYQTSLVILTSLALIWALRQTYAEAGKLRIRDAFYKSMQPLIPFILVSFVIVLQLIPFLITAGLYSSIQSGGLATTGAEQLLWAFVLMLGLGVSLYYVSSSIFALYIVTLPGTQPRAALKAARKLVRFRRAIILRKIVFLPIALLFFTAIVLIPLIIIFAPAAEVLFLLFTILVLGLVHSYYYTLYRSMI